jgi:aminoglycoside 3-N-acetyltransferase I
LFVLFKRVFDGIEIAVEILPDDDYLEELLSKNTFHIFAAIHDGVIVGGITAYELPMYFKKEKELYLYDLAVDASFRRNGIAVALIKQLKLYAVANNIATIFVEALADEPEAIAFYRAAGAQMERVCHFNFDIN